jgi:hypothetical protein
MRLDTRYVYLLLILISLLAMGCSKSSTNPPPPSNQAPTIILVTHPASTIHTSDNAVFTWRGSDPENSLASFYIDAMTGVFTATTDTTATYTNLPEGANYTFRAFATDQEGLHSDTVSWTFSVVATPLVVMGIAGQGLVDEDQDLMWTQFRINWSPVVDLNAQTVGLRLLVGVRPSAGGPETLDSTDLISRSPGEDDTLYYMLPTFTRNYYDMRAELHKADGTLLINIPYDSITSLKDVGLEDIDGFSAWFASVDTSNGIDTLAPLGYYESIDIWVDIDEYGDPANIRLTLFERTSAEEQIGQEHVMSPDLLSIIQGIGPQDKLGWTITALSAPDVYDYRLELHDHFTNELLAQVNYGEPALTNIPLGINISSQHRNRVEWLSR